MWFIFSRYFPHVTLKDIVEKMGFESEKEARDWLSSNYSISPTHEGDDFDTIVFNCKQVNLMLAEKGVS